MFGGIDMEDDAHVQRRTLASVVKGKISANGVLPENCTRYGRPF